MRSGKTLSFGDVILARMQFVDSNKVNVRPACVLLEEHGNIVVAGITSNPRMEGIPWTKQEGARLASVIKLNYIFTIAHQLVKKRLAVLPETKKTVIRTELIKKLR